MRECGNRGCDRTATVSLLVSGGPATPRLYDCCPDCAKHFDADHVSATVSVRRMGEDELLACEVMESYDFVGTWAPYWRGPGT